LGGRSFLGIHKPAAICNRRTVSLQSTMWWRPASFSAAKVGPKSGRLSQYPQHLFLKTRTANRRTCRVLRPSRSAARIGCSSPSTTAW
jgi:hypothetical protein